MKKVFINPKITFVELNCSDLICTSGGLEGIEVGDANRSADARRRTSIWDDEF